MKKKITGKVNTEETRELDLKDQDHMIMILVSVVKIESDQIDVMINKMIDNLLVIFKIEEPKDSSKED